MWSHLRRTCTPRGVRTQNLGGPTSQRPTVHCEHVRKLTSRMLRFAQRAR